MSQIDKKTDSLGNFFAFDHDKNGNPTSIADKSSTTSFTYDASGNRPSLAPLCGETTDYARAANNRSRASQILPAPGRPVTPTTL